MNQDPDYDWLLAHKPGKQGLVERIDLAKKVADLLTDRIRTGNLPYTVGVFGGWGSGKTTFLALLAEQLQREPGYRIIYFNSWKYAGFMEIVPSLIYKILQYGVTDTDERRDKAAMRVLLSLGKEYSDRFDKWAEERMGVNLIELFKDVHKLGDLVKEGETIVKPELMRAYYTQVDKAQDTLKEVLGSVESGKAAKTPVIVLIDELDRCDPDEAFNVIKQMRVLFAMRRLPVAFVVCANPEPIGLAIKHRYGLESASGDYEARRILEKFVDAYEDLSETAPLGDLARTIWKEASIALQPWILAVDEASEKTSDDALLAATCFDTMTTAAPLYSNLRVLKKSFDYVNGRTTSNRHLLWTIWHLEIASQVDPQFRSTLRMLAPQIGDITSASYADLNGVFFSVERDTVPKSLKFDTPKGKTPFAVFRSFFWENTRKQAQALGERPDPESREKCRMLGELLFDYRKVDFVVVLSLLPFGSAPSNEELMNTTGKVTLPALTEEFKCELGAQFGWLLANY